MTHSTRRALVAGSLALAFAGSAAAQARPRLVVYKTPWCGCCGAWVDHMRQAGWRTQVIEVQDLAPVRARQGVPERLASCHTGVVGRYAIEGHVPASDVARLVREAPAARALSAPGMPAGSPGMEAAGKQPYQTLLIFADGRTEIFARHNGA